MIDGRVVGMKEGDRLLSVEILNAATVHFAARTAALLAGWMAVRAKEECFQNRVNATDLSLLVRPCAELGG
jgi:hypothetical protein